MGKPCGIGGGAKHPAAVCAAGGFPQPLILPTAGVGGEPSDHAPDGRVLPHQILARGAPHAGLPGQPEAR